MKNQYFGDVGDFGKYGLLTALSSNEIKLGVNWYLTQDDEKSDGKFVDYLSKQEFKICDDELHSFLHSCIHSSSRNVSEISKFKRFEEVAFHDDLLHMEDIGALSESGRNKRDFRRKKWFGQSLENLSNCDLIFCDPDNGIETKSLSKHGKDSVKYVFVKEIQTMIDNGFSVVVYNHRDRSPESTYKARMMDIVKSLDGKASLRVLRFNRYSVRDYLIFMQPHHVEKLNDNVDQLLADSYWNKHFSEFKIE